MRTRALDSASATATASGFYYFKKKKKIGLGYFRGDCKKRGREGEGR